MLSQGDQLLQQLRQYDQLKLQNNNTSTNILVPPQQGEENDEITPALGQYKPDSLQLKRGESIQDLYTSLKILNNRPKYVPPINFSLVEEGIYRSGHPQPINYEYLKILNLKTIIYIGDKEDNYEYYKFIEQENINFKYLKLETDEAPLLYRNPESLTQALNIIVNVENYPILIHSNKGKHRIGVLVGLMRKFLQGWCLSGIFDEYDKFAGGKGDIDLEFIETFQCSLNVNEEKKPSFVRL